MRKLGSCLTCALLLLALAIPGSFAQPGPEMGGQNDGPPFMRQGPDGDNFPPGTPGMRPDMGPGMRPGMKKGRPGMKERKQDPEMEKLMNQRNAMMAIAEAHKELAGIYEKQNKIDEAANELKQIIQLTNDAVEKMPAEGPMRSQLVRKIIPVYHEIARLYLKNDRVSDAEKVVNEGISKFEKDDPTSATKLILHLGEIHKRNNDMPKAEEAFKRVIELNKKNLE